MKKKILLGLGGVVAVASPVVAAVSCGTQDEEAKISKIPKKVKEKMDVIVKAVSTFLAVPEDKTEMLEENLYTFIKSGLNGIKYEDVKNIMDSFGVAENTQNMLKSFLTKKDSSGKQVMDLSIVEGLVNMFNKGLNKIGDQEGYSKLKDALRSLLPASITIGDDLIDKLLYQGFKDEAEFTNVLKSTIMNLDAVKNIIKTSNTTVSGVVKDLIADIIKGIYDKFPNLLKTGILNINKEGFKDIINWDLKLKVPSFGTLIGYSTEIPDDIKPTINKIKYDLTAKSVDVLGTLSNFLSKKSEDNNASAKDNDFSAFDKIKNVFSEMKKLLKSSDQSVEDIQNALIKLRINGISGIDENASNVIGNIYSYINQKSSDNLTKLKEELVSVFNGKFKDAANTGAVDTTTITNAQDGEKAIDAAKLIQAFDAKGSNTKGAKFITTTKVADIEKKYTFDYTQATKDNYKKAWIDAWEENKKILIYKERDISGFMPVIKQQDYTMLKKYWTMFYSGNAKVTMFFVFNKSDTNLDNPLEITTEIAQNATDKSKYQSLKLANVNDLSKYLKLPKGLGAKSILKNLTLADKSDKSISKAINMFVENKDQIFNFLLNGVSKMTTDEIETFITDSFLPLLESILPKKYASYVPVAKSLLKDLIKLIATN